MSSIRYISVSSIDANVEPGLHELVQVGYQYPDGKRRWFDVQSAEPRYQYIEGQKTTIVFPLDETDMHIVNEAFQRSLQDKHVPGAESMEITLIQRKITIIVGGTEPA